MIPRSSIFIAITFIFLLALTSIGLAFLWLMDYDRQNYARELNNRYSNVARAHLFYMSGIIDKDQFVRQIEGIDMPDVSSAQLREKVLKDGKVIDEISADIGSSAIIEYKRRHYLKISHLDDMKLLADKDYQPYRYYVIKLIFAIVAIVLLSAYVFVIYKLKPLRRLKRQIDKFATGDLANIENVSAGNDEISEVSQAFYDAISEINLLNNSRQLFLRNIMHELKTPITKGLITAQMIPDGKHRQRLISLFHRLEGLINELAAVEQTTSNVGLGARAMCNVQDVVDEAIDMALVSTEQVVVIIDDESPIEVDFRLFSTAMKNMIDNGIKYSNDKKVKLIISADEIAFFSSGERLSGELGLYTQPFIKGDNAKDSFGLGLYIVNSILKSHGLNLEYAHINGVNIFKFKNLKSIRQSNV